MSNDSTSMATGRALTTETEREYLRGEHGDQRMYEARSRLKARMKQELAQDVDLFEEAAPELLDLLQSVVCDDRAMSD